VKSSDFIVLVLMSGWSILSTSVPGRVVVILLMRYNDEFGIRLMLFIKYLDLPMLAVRMST